MARYNRVDLFTLTGSGGEAYRRLSLALKEAGATELKKNLARRIRVAAKPVLRDVKQAYITMPDVSPAHRTGAQARATVAAAVRLELRTTGGNAGVRILVDRRKLPDDMKALPFAWERGRWRHPVFPRSDQTRQQWRWVVQRTRPPFRAAVAGHEAQFRTAVVDAMEDTANALRLGR